MCEGPFSGSLLCLSSYMSFLHSPFYAFSWSFRPSLTFLSFFTSCLYLLIAFLDLICFALPVLCFCPPFSTSISLSFSKFHCFCSLSLSVVRSLHLCPSVHGSLCDVLVSQEFTARRTYSTPSRCMSWLDRLTNLVCIRSCLLWDLSFLKA